MKFSIYLNRHVFVMNNWVQLCPVTLISNNLRCLLIFYEAIILAVIWRGRCYREANYIYKHSTSWNQKSGYYREVAVVER